MATAAAPNKIPPFPNQLFGWKIIDRTPPHAADQDVRYQATWTRLCGHITARRGVVVRVEIRRNAYDMQSYSKLEVLNRETLGWTTLVYLSQSRMQVLRKMPENRRVDVVSYGRFDGNAEALGCFVSDENELLLQATAILDAAI